MGKKVLIATGTSANKRTRAVAALTDYFKAKGHADVTVVADNVYTMDLGAIKPDVIVLIGPKSFTTTVPIIDGTAFITQIASMVADTCKKVEAALALK
jgi:hypothetical protein